MSRFFLALPLALACRVPPAADSGPAAPVTTPTVQSLDALADGDPIFTLGAPPEAHAEAVGELLAGHQETLRALDVELMDVDAEIADAEAALAADLEALLGPEQAAEVLGGDLEVAVGSLDEEPWFADLSPGEQDAVDAALEAFLEGALTAEAPDDMAAAAEDLEASLEEALGEDIGEALGYGVRLLIAYAEALPTTIGSPGDYGDGEGVMIDDDSHEEGLDAAPPPFVQWGGSWGGQGPDWCLIGDSGDLPAIAQDFAMSEVTARWSARSRLVLRHDCASPDTVILGLGHEPGVGGAIMFPNYSGSQRALHTDDINGVQSRYGAPADVCFDAYINAYDGYLDAHSAWNQARRAHNKGGDSAATRAMQRAAQAKLLAASAWKLHRTARNHQSEIHARIGSILSGLGAWFMESGGLASPGMRNNIASFQRLALDAHYSLVVGNDAGADCADSL